MQHSLQINMLSFKVDMLAHQFLELDLIEVERVLQVFILLQKLLIFNLLKRCLILQRL